MCDERDPPKDENPPAHDVPSPDVSLRMFERSRGVFPDERDLLLYAERLARWLAIPASKPRVGDFLFVDAGGNPPLFKRFTHAWPDGIQTTAGRPRPLERNERSFYIDRDASVSYSGGLDAVIPYDNLLLVTECLAYMAPYLGELIVARVPMLVEGVFWFFKHDRPGASRGLYCTLPCRVWRIAPLDRSPLLRNGR
jgi:hypothetical protein